ncbi:MAG: hypothetical protein IT162_06595, partial [Bryobacterales bacterium]|nr:hypothetical protein [Bryobacterales bacterium]
AFEAQAGGAAPTPRTVTVTSTTNAALAFSAASNQAWLSVTPNSGATPGAVSVSVNPAGLAAGTYSGAVTLTPPSPSTPVSIPVTLTVTAAPVTPQLATAPAALAFNAEIGAAAPAARAVTVTSTTSAVLSFTAAANQSWLLVTPNGGSTPGSVSVSVNLNGLAAGSYSAVVTLTPPSPSLPVTIPVTLTVAAAPVTPQLAPSPAALAFEAQAGGAVPAPRPVNVASTTSAVLSFTATSNQPWLAVTPNGGSTPGTLSVSVNTTGLAAGTYSGSVTLTPPLPSAPFVIPVTLTVTSPPVTPQLTPAPASLTFEAQSGGAPPAPRSLTLTSSTGAALAFSASGNQPWLAVTPATASTPGAISVSVNQAGLAAGVYGGAVTLTPPSPSSPITIPVTFTVTAAPVTPQLTALPAGLTFDAQAGGNATQAQTVSLSSSTGAALTYTVAPNAAWLLVSAATGSTPGTIHISVNPSTLAAGQYSGSVTLTPPAPSTPLVIPVSVRVTAPPAGGGGGGTTPQLSVSPASMAFTAQGGTPSVQTRVLGVSLANANAAISYSAAVNVPWLSLSLASGFTPGSITVTASSAGLSPGVYNGVVTLSSTSPVPVVSVPVTLTVTETGPSPAPPPPQLASTAPPLVFAHVLGSAPPAPQSLRIENRATGAAPVAVLLRSTVAWLSVSPAQGVTPLAVTVTLQPSGVAAGSYDGAILASAAGGNEIAIPVRLTVSQPGNGGPLPGSANLTALVNAASQTPGAISPGALVTIYGSGLGPGNGQSGKPDATGRIEKSVAGTRVWFGAVPAPVLFASSTQVNAIVPFEVQGLAAVDVAVEYQGQRSTPRSATVIPAAPALFTLNASGAGPAAALNQDYTVNSPSAPARRGTVIVLYATGFGVMPGVDTGQVAGADLARPNVPVTVTIGGIAAEILYAGSAPGLVQGVVQLNVLVPPNSPARQPVAVQVTANGRASQAGVTIAVE